MFNHHYVHLALQILAFVWILSVGIITIRIVHVEFHNWRKTGKAFEYWDWRMTVLCLVMTLLPILNTALAATSLWAYWEEDADGPTIG